MNNKLKERIKLSLAIAVLAVIIIVVLMIVAQYQVQGETNMPYKLSKITIISTAEGEEKEVEEQTIMIYTFLLNRMEKIQRNKIY